jgi:trigger factor
VAKTKNGASGAVIPASRLGRMDPKALDRMLQPGRVPLPTVEAPSLDGLHVKMGAPDPIAHDEVKERLWELSRRFGKLRARRPGELLAEGDDICVDMLGYAAGKLIPFSPREKAWTVMAESLALPGLFEQLLGKPVPSGQQAEIRLRDDFRIAALRGQPAVYLIDVHEARQVEPLDPQTPAFAQAYGKGKGVDDTVDAVIAELEDERSSDLTLYAVNRVLDALLERAPVKPSDEVVDDQIRAAWMAIEAPILSRKDFTAEEQEQALQGWLSDPDTREECARRISTTVVLKAIAERDNITATPESLRQLKQGAAEGLGMKQKELDQIIDWELPDTTVASAVHLLTVQHVVSKAQIEFEKAVPSTRPPKG